MGLRPIRSCAAARPLLERSSESFGRFADYESPGCKADMAEGSAEEEQSSTAAPASPPADLRTLNTQLSPPYHHQPHLQSRLQHLQHSNMLATAVPPRHSLSMLSHQVKAEAELDAPCDVPLNLKSEVSAGIPLVDYWCWKSANCFRLFIFDVFCSPSSYIWAEIATHCMTSINNYCRKNERTVPGKLFRRNVYILAWCSK